MNSTLSSISSTLTPTSTGTTSSASATSTGNGGGGGSTGPSSPLLFFVALGFGVVFTNLWIIVGVKYCFRYNQRNRARLNGEDPDAVDMAAMPRQRRRREKKLMTMEEVNERFPLVKYKTWRSTRAEEGLPTAGGIASASSRPASIKHEARVSEDESEDKANSNKSTSESVTEKPGSSEHAPPEVALNDTQNATSEERPATAVSNHAAPKPATREEEEEDTDQIQTAIPAEQLPDPGDMCAICIDTIEDDDDIRGLTCGHAFHASCVDPWLTSRRACCPLCKADYFVPKPRPEGETEEQQRRNTQGQGMPQPTYTILTHSRSGRMTRAMVIPTRFLTGNPQARASHRHPSASQRRRQRQRAAAPTTSPEVTTGEEPPSQEAPSWRQRIANVRLPALPPISRTRAGRTTEPGPQPPTPGQLEEGRTT